MVDFGGTFNADEHEDMSDYSILPPGWYLCNVTKDEKRESKSTPGSFMLSLEYTIIDGKMKGRKIFTNLNLWHTKQNVVEIAQRELASICRAVGKPQMGNSSELYNIPFGVKIGHKKNKETNEMEERINAYCSERDFSANSAGTNSSSPSSSGGNAGGNSSSGPWAKQG